MDRFVGKVVKFDIDGHEYKLKSPPARVIPKFLSLQGKNPENFGEGEWEILTNTIVEAVKRTYPEWSEEEIDDFVVQNMLILQEKLPIAMGWMTETEIAKFTEKYADTKSEDK